MVANFLISAPGTVRVGRRQGNGENPRRQTGRNRRKGPGAAGSGKGRRLRRRARASPRAARGLTEGPDQSSAVGPLGTGTSNWGQSACVPPGGRAPSEAPAPCGSGPAEGSAPTRSQVDLTQNITGKWGFYKVPLEREQGPRAAYRCPPEFRAPHPLLPAPRAQARSLSESPRPPAALAAPRRSGACRADK